MRSQDNTNSSLAVVSGGLTITHNNDKCNILTTTTTTITTTSSTTTTTTSTTTNSCITSCPHKGKIQTLRQRKTELEKLLEEKNLLLQQLQKQEAHIINSNNNRHNNDWLTTSRTIPETTSSSSSSITTTGGNHFHNDNQMQQQQQQQQLQQQQQNMASIIPTSAMTTSSSSSTLRRKVGSSFKLPRMTKKEHQADIENLLLEKKIQQEICNASYKLANDITLAKSVRRNQKAEYEAAQQKLSIINQNINILKKRQLRSHSTSFSESSPSAVAYNTNSSNNSNNVNTISGNMSSLSLKSSPLLSATPPPPPPPLQSIPAPVSISQTTSATVLPTNLGNNLNYNLKSNLNDYTPLLLSSKRSSNTIGLTTMTNNYITNTVNNINNLLNNSTNSNTMKNNGSNKSIGNLKNSPNNYSSNDRRNSIKSAILNSSSSKNDNSSPSGLIQHFDRTLKNHRSDYDINRMVPSSQKIDKYQFIDNFSPTTTTTNTNYRISGSYSLGSGDAGGGGCISGDGIGDIAGLSASDFVYLSSNNNNYCNTFPIQQTHNQRSNHHDITDCDPSPSTSSTSQQHLHQQSQFMNCENILDTNDCYNINLTHDNDFEVMNRNRTSGNFEKLSSPLLPNKKDGRYCSGQYLLQNPIATTAISKSYDNENSNTISYPSRNCNTNSEYDHHVKQIYEQNLKQNKRFQNNNDTFDTVSLYPIQLNNSTNLLQQQQQQPQSGLGGYWKTLPNNEKVWHSTIDDNNYDGKRTGPSINNKIQHTSSSSSYISNDMLTAHSLITVPTTIKDELSDKISISSANSETNKKPREKQWLETSLDSPIMHPKHSNLANNHQDSGIQQRPVSHQYLHHHHHHHHDGNTMFSPSTPVTTTSTDQCNLNTIPNYLYPTNHKIHNNGFKERSKLSSQSMSNKMYQRSTVQQRLEDQSRLSHSTSVLNRQFTDHHHHHYHHQQQQQQQHQSQNYHQNNNNVLTNENSNLYLLNTDDNEKLKQQQLQSNNHLLHGHHHHHHPLTILSSPTSINNRRINNVGNVIPNITSSDSSYVYTSNNTTGTITNIINNNSNNNNNNNNSNNNNNVNKNSFGSVLMTNTMCKAQEIRVESPKNMTVIQKAVFVPYKEVTKPFEMSDFYKYSTKFRQKDNHQQQQHNDMNNSGSGMILKQQQQHLITTQANSCETRNTATTVVGEVK